MAAGGAGLEASLASAFGWSLRAVDSFQIEVRQLIVEADFLLSRGAAGEIYLLDGPTVEIFRFLLVHVLFVHAEGSALGKELVRAISRRALRGGAVREIADVDRQ